MKLAGGGVAVLLAFLAIYAASVFLWAWVFMLLQALIVTHTVGTSPGYWTETWGYWQAVAPWGLIAPFVLG